NAVVIPGHNALPASPPRPPKLAAGGGAIYSDGTERGIAGMVCSLRDFAVNFLGICTFSAILGVLHPLLLVLLVFTSLVPGIAANRAASYRFHMRKNWQPFDKQIDYIYSHATAAGEGKEIRLYDAAGFFLGKLAGAVKKRLAWLRKTTLCSLGAEGADALTLVLQNSVSFAWISWEIISGKISIADFTFYSGAIMQFTQFMNRFVRSYSTVKQCSYDVQLVREALSYMPQKNGEKGIAETGRPAKQKKAGQESADRSRSLRQSHSPVHRKAPEICFEHVSFSYPGSEAPVLKDVSFCVRAREKLALVGANGAGKTTIVKLLCGFYRPDAGRILVDGVDIAEMEKEELYGLFSAVFQDMLVLPFSVLENVAPAGRADVERVRQCLEKAGLSGRFPDLNQPLVKGVRDGAENLSGGEEQKLLLARALYKEAPALILDEPTAALDPIAESELYGKYNEFTKEKTSFFISHRLASTGFCDRILLLGEGKILEEGSHRELLERGGQYARMFHEQSKYYTEQEEAEK
ncbi:MAG: ABC transporter ATP-binding protein/permease, partial [Lachnospiraceae bacterium]|nr:ABC transporter ATP-binding protein/permease [Lachnospiraceae bacterium]